ncbi:MULTISPECIES: OprD family porin [Pseudomonas]|uniref:OprD family porin n=1 Tax=Pseudomonas TaxID=286 RepID=UPI0013A76A82|nr:MULTISPECIES: OprD family porin [Pseudomonas]QIB51391.1 OprD family porin [Pseudomonas sp. OIL-1]
MKNAVKWSSLALAVAMGNGVIASHALAQESTPGVGIVEGATATLSSRTMYFNRDFRDDDGNADGIREEAATGMVLDFQSGYSEGLIGLGFDVTAMGGLKLDSGSGRTGTGILPVDPDGSAPNEYAEIRGTVKGRIAEDTVLRYGTHFVENPVVAYEDARLLPNHYYGYSVTNESIEGLFVEAGRMTDRGEMAGSSQTNDGYRISTDDYSYGGDVSYLGGSYTFNDALAATLYTSKADELWKRHFLGLAHTAELTDALSLTTELSHYNTSDDSGAEANFDNDATSLALTLGAGNHGFTVAYQRMNGDSGYSYLDGAVFLANSVQYSDFNAKDERSWQARYDYDFAGLGIPGLTFMTRYITSSDIDTEYEGVERDSRWERDTNISYTVQNGTLEGVNILWRNATVRQAAAFDGDIDENRLIVSYSWDLL